MGCLGGSVGWASDFSSGHDLTVREFKSCVRLCADSSEPGASFRFCVSLFSHYPSPTHAVSLSIKKWIKIKKIKKISLIMKFEVCICQNSVPSAANYEATINLLLHNSSVQSNLRNSEYLIFAHDSYFLESGNRSKCGSDTIPVTKTMTAQ